MEKVLKKLSEKGFYYGLTTRDSGIKQYNQALGYNGSYYLGDNGYYYFNHTNNQYINVNLYNKEILTNAPIDEDMLEIFKLILEDINSNSK